MAVISMKKLLEAGVHFGHQTRKWNPKMREYIFGEKNGIHIIDLQKSVKKVEEAYKFIREVVSGKGSVLFVGTKRQAQDSVEEEAKRCGMFFVTQRWLGGTLTNFRTLRKSIERLKELEKMEKEGGFEALLKKEVIKLKKEKVKLEKSLSGIKDMEGIPQAMFVVDIKREKIAVAEAKKLNIPLVAIVDTNCDPNEVDYPIPGNEDAIRAIRLLTNRIAEAALEGRGILAEKEIAAKTKKGEAGEPAEEPQLKEGKGEKPERPDAAPPLVKEEEERKSKEIEKASAKKTEGEEKEKEKKK